ncbi:erythromycin esterase [Purpureocillium lavendulum]|uniref:Erythromycin esterase n=1 Tax=Purpureocillium lavendulum TaxID=1247861 RepID=A0AB34FIC4_9HYPO|nr:erythromycin esterase [Purpureocillium lavendulum]
MIKVNSSNMSPFPATCVTANRFDGQSMAADDMKIDCELRFDSSHLQPGSKRTVDDTAVAAAEKEKVCAVFNIVAAEADWPDAEAVDRYVRRRPGPGPTAGVEPVRQAEEAGEEPAFMRFPTWMWRNAEMHDFVEWLRDYNKDMPVKQATGFYGLGATSMGMNRDEFNIGQLCKEAFGNSCLAIGCGTNSGTVSAARRWGGDMRIMKVRPGLANSYEALMHATGISNFALDLRQRKCDKKLRRELLRRRLERFIGVIYRPDTERQSHYSSAVLPEQLDGYIWMDITRHVTPMEVHQPPGALAVDETWPFGL